MSSSDPEPALSEEPPARSAYRGKHSGSVGAVSASCSASVSTENTSNMVGIRQRKANKGQSDTSASSASVPRTRFAFQPATAEGEPESKTVNTQSAKKEGKSYVDSLLSGLRPSVDASTHHGVITIIDSHLRYFSIFVICTWITLVIGVYALTPRDNIVRLSGVEQRGAVLGMSLIAASFLSRVIPLFGGVTNSITNKLTAGARKTNLSGIFLGGLTVQIVAFFTDVLMAYFPTPVLDDPVLGTPIHLLRWCEWCPCTFYMTFMMEGADLYWEGEVPPPDFLRQKYVHAATQGAAVFLGLCLSFCPGPKTWACVYITAMSMYFGNFQRLKSRYDAVPSSLKKGATVEEAERFNAANIALKLRFVCIFVWTILVVLFFATSIYGPNFSHEGSLLRSPEARMIAECFFDVLSKVLFLVTIVDVHHAIFDPFARTERRLEELRQLMSAVWETSSDVIAISVKTGSAGGASTMLSPAFFGMGRGQKQRRRNSFENSVRVNRGKSVLFQLENEAFEVVGRRENSLPNPRNGAVTDSATSSNEEVLEPSVTADMISGIECTGFSLSEPLAGGLRFKDDGLKPEIGSLRAVADVVVRAWNCAEREVVLAHNMRWVNTENGRQIAVQSEAKVSRLDDDALIVIVRDISERVRVFEAEKQILFETTSRLKDAEANRFTRHEVKNGLLAAIGLYESLCEAQRNQLTSGQPRMSTSVSMNNFDLGDHVVDGDTSENVVRCMNELGKSLHDTLESILAEAMTRDLVHDLYRLQKEKIDIGSLLGGTSDADLGTVGNLTRFPLITRPSPLPIFYSDPQLLRYLHRQVLSNACKYGKTGGSVLTEIIFDEKKQRITINVINLPGEFHDRIVAMGSKAEDAVFAKGAQIHERFLNDSDSAITKKSDSTQIPGDGGWIIQKMAVMLKGECRIKFENTRTMFTLSMPAKPFGGEKIRTPIDIKTFKLPQGIWGIGIDDSKIQQKLLVKFFEFAGISKDKIKVFGKDSEEIMGFVNFVVNFMDEHMGEQVLLIADENLEVTDGASHHTTISGSELVERIRTRILPEQERDLISLIRSANDSSSDVAIYKARAHGFLPKAPIKKANVLETLAPLWLARYPPKCDYDNDDISASASLARQDSLSSLESSASFNEAVASTPIEIIQTLNVIDELFSSNDVMANWNEIWEKLHALKGDLLTLQVGSKVISAVGMINSFRELRTSDELRERWGLLRERIQGLASSSV
eukprot:CAMPEP_0171332298 /NCGR_PEP_ID=MMETSP0878-20121228/3258_1 /TAXON_ID=67004 /ORGANISM="Thalassiosira weissflogii, Strain CCMP1336" /LENGTH=1223 /DNA_ID=CAMNT_0011832997 /DNA_START=130 /DNA_END=3801 /DNA_ORIENTATION=+